MFTANGNNSPICVLFSFVLSESTTRDLITWCQRFMFTLYSGQWHEINQINRSCVIKNTTPEEKKSWPDRDSCPSNGCNTLLLLASYGILSICKEALYDDVRCFLSRPLLTLTKYREDKQWKVSGLNVSLPILWCYTTEIYFSVVFSPWSHHCSELFKVIPAD